MEENLNTYLNQMMIIKKRMEVISNIYSQKYTTGFKYSDVEICVLQIRKIIELIAMSSLISNVDLYSRVYENYNKHWNAKYIFRDIEKLNPNFYPVPIRTEKNNGVDNFVELKNDYLKKEEAIKILDKCSALLHEDNPYKSPIDLSYYENAIPDWYNKIQALLACHIVRLLDGCLYYVIMSSYPDGVPYGKVFEPVNKLG